MAAIPATFDSPMRQGVATADARKTSHDYGEWTSEGVSTSVQQGQMTVRRTKRSVLILGIKLIEELG